MQFLTSSVWLDTLTETLHANFSFCPQQSCSLSLLAAQVMCHSPPHQPPSHIDTLLIAQLWREVLKNAPAFITHPWRCFVCHRVRHLDEMSCFTFYLFFISSSVACSSVNALWLNVFATASIFVRKTIWKQREHSTEGWDFFGTLLMWFSMFCRDLFSFCYPFWLYDFFLWELCVNLYACGSFCLFLSILYVCVCYKRDYFQFIYLITQQKDRSSVRDSVSSVCTLYDSVCLLFFYLICQVRPFSFSLRLSISVITLKSCTVPFEQEWVTTKL